MVVTVAAVEVALPGPLAGHVGGAVAESSSSRGPQCDKCGVHESQLPHDVLLRGGSEDSFVQLCQACYAAAGGPTGDSHSTPSSSLTDSQDNKWWCCGRCSSWRKGWQLRETGSYCPVCGYPDMIEVVRQEEPPTCQRCGIGSDLVPMTGNLCLDCWASRDTKDGSGTVLQLTGGASDSNSSGSDVEFGRS